MVYFGEKKRLDICSRLEIKLFRRSGTGKFKEEWSFWYIQTQHQKNLLHYYYKTYDARAPEPGSVWDIGAEEEHLLDCTVL